MSVNELETLNTRRFQWLDGFDPPIPTDNSLPVLADTSALAASVQFHISDHTLRAFGMKIRGSNRSPLKKLMQPFIRLAESTEPQPLSMRSSSMKHSAATSSFDAKALSALGSGEVGYIKPICNEADYIKSFFPEIRFAHGMELFALYSADGMPLMVSASLAAAKQNARAHCLATVTIH
jgi:hypothetical protein